MPTPKPTTVVPWVPVLLGWSAVLVTAVAQEVLLAHLRGTQQDIVGILRDNAFILGLWALATPAVLRSAARWPIRGPGRWRHIAYHVLAAVTFVIALNAAIRVPLLASREPFLPSLAAGLTRYGPQAVLVYGVLVGIGHALLGKRGEQEPVMANGRLVIRDGARTTMLATDEIAWIEAANNYVRIHGPDRSALVRYRISELERELDPGRFVRIHRSAIVAVAAVREVRTRSHGDATVVLREGRELRVSRARRAALQTALDGS